MKEYLIKKGEHRSPATEFKNGERPSIKTEFKKGMVPHNKRDIGFITIRKDKNGRKRRYIKIGDGAYEWQVYTKYLWEKNNGKIPNGMFVHHIDKNSMNDHVSNYQLVDSHTHALLHRENLVGNNKLGKNRKN